MNLIVGATGMLGSEICRLLISAGKPVRGLVRPTSNGDKVAMLDALGVNLVLGDMKDRKSLDTACRGARAIISTASSTFSRQEGDSIQSVDLQGQLSLLEAAKAAGVAHFVQVSFASVEDEFPLQTAKRTVEEHLKASGMTYTILQPTAFMEVWLSPALGFDFPSAKAQLFGTGENKLSWISYTDVARFAAASLDNPKSRNAVFKLGGPEALSPREVARIFEEVGGRKFDVQCVPEAALRKQKQEATDPFE